jgi:hypothetical protein
VVRLENQVLTLENEQLRARVEALEKIAPTPGTWSREPDLSLVSSWLDKAGYVYRKSDTGASLRLEYAGANTSFAMTIQHYPKAKVLLLATNEYLRIDEAPDARGIVLLLVKLAALNYDLLIGKFQLDPESGDILLSAELQLDDGLGYDTFIRTLDHLFRTADETWPELSQAAGGRGI